MQPNGCLWLMERFPRPHEMEMEETDEAFKALADPSRRLLLDRLNARNGQTLRELCAGQSMARQSVSKHLAVLELANLVTTVWRGREKLHYLNAAPINAIADRWISQYHRTRVQTLADLKTALETESMSDTEEFVYTTYIRTTPQRLWLAITDPVFSGRYLGHAMVSDWEKGSTYAWVENDLTIEHPDQLILESDPYHRLVFAFHTFVPELTAFGLSETVIARAAAERRSTVSFELEPRGEQVKLTVVHGEFGPNSTVRGLISGGWPLKLSNLKTELERS